MDAATHVPAPRADLFDPASLAALGRIEIVARWIVDGFMSGLHRSPRKGFSVEFAEYRPYQPGDDLRYIHWKIAPRSDRWVGRQYQEETNPPATGCFTDYISKLELPARTAGNLLCQPDISGINKYSALDNAEELGS